MRRLCTCALLTLLVGCGPKPAPSTDPEPAADTGDQAAPTTASADTARGGQLFDKWWAGSESFTPDAKDTEAADGKGGPNGDGTLNLGGQALLNSGHDFRLKNFFGWDLRGQAGIYGPDYQNKSTAVNVDLLSDTRSAEELAKWLAAGDDAVPALGEVLGPEDISNLAAFVVGVRDRALPHPDQIWNLSKDAPKNYTLVEGADAAAGAELFSSKCAGCHGKDGTSITIDDHYTLGAYARTKAYEAWIKILNGQPGSPMGRQTDQAAEILNVLAALCDRGSFPGKDAEHDAPDGDPRCGAYLK